MAIKKYTNGSWVPASYRKYGTETDAITTLPATVIGDGTPISSYTIKGNMEQTSTPTPENPIIPSECGERTENLIDSELEQGTFNSSGQEYPSTARIRSDYIYIQKSDNYTISLTGAKGVVVYVYDANKSYLPSESTVGWQTLPFAREIEAKRYIRFAFAKNASGNSETIVPSDVSNIMLNEGSTAPESYIPYGYKLPITLGDTTTNIYLGEVQTTRRIKKLVLTGNEGCYSYDFQGQKGALIFDLLDANHTREKGFCSHYQVYPNGALTSLWIGVNNKNLYFIGIFDALGISTIDEFKSFLAAQYAAGTPVTVWYILKEPETAVVNEPIRKIGDYVDSVSGTGLATSGTTQQFDVGTTLKPSEVDLTYHGWHEHEDTKYST